VSDEITGATRHGGDRSFQRDVTWEAVRHVVRNGVPTPQENGNTKHVGRHPSIPDHLITVVVSPKKEIVTTFKTHSPIAAIESQQRAKAQADRERVTKSKSRQAEQLAKKRARTPKPKNK